MQDGKELTLREKMQVSSAVCSFKEQLKITEQQHLTERDREWASKECLWDA
jgi:hypothetical protein